MLFGGEGPGLSDEARAASEALLHITQFGSTRSVNAGAAAAIAIHTWFGVVKGYKMPYMWFVVSILGIWLAALILTFLGPAIHEDRFFVRAGGWCWISKGFQSERLWLHYVWIFIVEFGTIAIYGHVFIHLRGRIRSVSHNDTSKLTRATKFMVLYPFV